MIIYLISGDSKISLMGKKKWHQHEHLNLNFIQNITQKLIIPRVKYFSYEFIISKLQVTVCFKF